ncbi:cleavage and polyadenylation specificity factor subunit 1 [Tanacetum coccineum]
MLCIPTIVQKKRSAFRFAHLIAYNKEFINIIKDAWDNDIDGYAMYKVVKKLKKLKSPINKLGWEKGSVYKRVTKLRNQIEEVHTQIDSNPHDKCLRIREAELLEEFLQAKADEEKFLLQQAKITWLSEGDKNTNFFHKVLKGFNELFYNKLNREEAEIMVGNVTDDEIKRALFDIDDSKAPVKEFFDSADFATNVLAEWNAVYDAHNEVACLMLRSMTPELHRQFENYSPYEMLQELKSMFEKQARVERLFGATGMERLGYVLSQDLSVGLILNGLTSDFASFIRNYNMHNMGKTIGELHALLIEYEKGLPKKASTPQVMAIQGGRIQKANKKSQKANHICQNVLHICQSLHGNVESVGVLSSGAEDRTSGRRRDSIILTFEDAKISVLEFDDSVNGLRTRRGWWFGSEDDGACGGGGSVSARMQSSYIISLKDLDVKNVKDFIFVHGYIEPVLVILHEKELTWAGRLPYKHHTCVISAVSISTTLKQHPLIWSATNLPHDAYKLFDVPSPIGGVFSASCILALNNYAVPFDSSQEMSRSSFSVELDAANATWLSNNVAMLSTKSGELLLLTLVHDGRWEIHHFDEDRMRKMPETVSFKAYLNTLQSKEGMEQEIVRIKGNL